MRLAASEMGSGMGKSDSESPLRVLSQIAALLWVSGCKPHWFSKLDVLGAHLSGAGLKS